MASAIEIHNQAGLEIYIQNGIKVYDSAMKFALLAIFVLFAAQPLQAASCDMQDGQINIHSQHGNMHDDNGDGMDCCDDDPVGTDDGCSSMSQCGTCPAGLAAVKPSLVNVIFNTDSQQYLTTGDAPACRFSTPPFRPPIS